MYFSWSSNYPKQKQKLLDKTKNLEWKKRLTCPWFTAQVIKIIAACHVSTLFQLKHILIPNNWLIKILYFFLLIVNKSSDIFVELLLAIKWGNFFAYLCNRNPNSIIHFWVYFSISFSIAENNYSIFRFWGVSMSSFNLSVLIHCVCCHDGRMKTVGKWKHLIFE